MISRLTGSISLLTILTSLTLSKKTFKTLQQILFFDHHSFEKNLSKLYFLQLKINKKLKQN